MEFFWLWFWQIPIARNNIQAMGEIDKPWPWVCWVWYLAVKIQIVICTFLTDGRTCHILFRFQNLWVSRTSNTLFHSYSHSFGYININGTLLAIGLWISPGTPVSPTNKTDRHDLTEILLKVAYHYIDVYF